jgi:hypothetical protein
LTLLLLEHVAERNCVIWLPILRPLSVESKSGKARKRGIA